MEIPPILFYWSAYLVIVIGLFVGLFWWRVKKRPGRHPLGDDVKLRRQAGEHLRIKMEKMNEELLHRLILLMFLPVIVMGIPIWIVGRFASVNHVGVLVAAGALLLAALIWGIRRLFHLTDQMQNTRLGWFGERVVADSLESLKGKGYEVFHDVPCVGAAGAFNLDHVAAGHGIIVVVETKTHSKLKSDAAGHKVSYDGEKLNWPWGHSTKELTQVLQSAEWLRKELKAKLNLDVTVQSALTMPGWFVTGGPPQAPVLVENTKRLPSFITQRFPSKLSLEQTDLVIRHLQSLCADVSFDKL